MASIESNGTTKARPKSRRLTRLIGLAAGLAVGLAACTSARPASPAAAGRGRTAVLAGMSCAWPDLLSAQTDDIAFPDPAEQTFWLPIVAPAGTRIVLSGRFPDARYASIQVYTPSGVGASLPDYRIAPRSGSVNPWQHRAAPGGRFTVTIGPGPVAGQANTLPMPTGTTSQHPGYLVYRVYLPAGGVPLPALTVERGSATRALPACRSRHAPAQLPTVSGPARSGAAAAPPVAREFFKPAPSSFNDAGLANADTSYALALLARPPAADVVVVTGRAPAFPAGSHPSPWPAGGEDVRYWSMCVGLLEHLVPIVANPLPGGGTDYGCRADEATRLNAAGDYTYVIGSESQRAAINAVPGVTFLPFSTAHPAGPYLLALRNVLVSPSFTHSPASVTRASDPAAAAAAMGPYYPRAVVCPLATLTAHRPQACPR